MKKLLLILLCVPLFGFGQLTYIPDSGFEIWIELNVQNASNGSLDNYVNTSAIENLYAGQDWSYTISDGNVKIFSIEGIENFKAGGNQSFTIIIKNTSIEQANLTNYSPAPYVGIVFGQNPYLKTITLPVSNDTLVYLGIEDLECSNDIPDYWGSSLEEVVFHQNSFYSGIHINSSNLCELNAEGNSVYYEQTSSSLPFGLFGSGGNLRLSGGLNGFFFKYSTNLKQIDLSQVALIGHSYLDPPFCIDIPLKAYGCMGTTVNSVLQQIKFSNTIPVLESNVDYGSPNLTPWNNLCFELPTVSDVNWANNHWTAELNYSTNCFNNSINCSNSTNLINEINNTKKIIKVIDIFGREVNEKRNTPLFYIYNDGTVEKKIIIE